MRLIGIILLVLGIYTFVGIEEAGKDFEAIKNTCIYSQYTSRDHAASAHMRGIGTRMHFLRLYSDTVNNS